jgi:mono/diheme cytochrome c family protein
LTSLTSREFVCAAVRVSILKDSDVYSCGVQTSDKLSFDNAGNKRTRAEVFPGVTRRGIWELLLLVGVLGSFPARAQVSSSRGTAEGERIFQQCTGCHGEKAGENRAGPSLKGLFQKHRLLNGSPATEQNIRLRIKNGGNGMPTFELVLSAKELDQLIGYLRKL